MTTTTTSQGAGKASSATPSKDATLQVTVSNLVIEYITSSPYFPNLAKVFRGGYPIVSVLMGIFQRESSWNYRAIASQKASTGSGTLGATVTSDIQSKFGTVPNLGVPNQGLIFSGLGIGQCMGWYLIRGTKTCLEMHGSGTFEPLCNSMGLLVNFGQSPLAAMLDNTVTPNGRGPFDTKGLRASIVASMVVFETKMKITYNPKKTTDQWVFDSVGAYLGTKGRDSLGTTPEAYKNQVRQFASNFASGKGLSSVSSSSSGGNPNAANNGGSGPVTDQLHCPQTS